MLDENITIDVDSYSELLKKAVLYNLLVEHALYNPSYSLVHDDLYFHISDDVLKIIIPHEMYQKKLEKLRKEEVKHNVTTK